MKTAYVGYTTMALPGWERYAPEAKAPANYKDPAKIAQYIEEIRKRQAEEASDKVMTGSLSSVVVVYSDGSVEQVEPSTSKGIARVFQLLNVDSIVCIRPFHLLRLLVAEVLSHPVDGGGYPKWAIRSESFGTPLLLAKDEKDVQIIDPVRALIGSSAADNTDLLAVAQRFGISPKGAPKSAEWKADMARTLGMMLGV